MKRSSTVNIAPKGQECRQAPFPQTGKRKSTVNHKTLDRFILNLEKETKHPCEKEMSSSMPTYNEEKVMLSRSGKASRVSTVTKTLHMFMRSLKAEQADAVPEEQTLREKAQAVIEDSKQFRELKKNIRARRIITNFAVGEIIGEILKDKENDFKITSRVEKRTYATQAA